MAYEQVIKLDPNYAFAYFNKGVILEKLNRKNEAHRVWELAKQLGWSG